MSIIFIYLNFYYYIMSYFIIIIRVFFPRASPSLQAQEPRLQFYEGLIGEVASCCFPHSILSLASEQALKDLKRSQGHQRGGEESGFG